jgi:hypothetical protein
VTQVPLHAPLYCQLKKDGPADQQFRQFLHGQDYLHYLLFDYQDAHSASSAFPHDREVVSFIVSGKKIHAEAVNI